MIAPFFDEPLEVLLIRWRIRKQRVVDQIVISPLKLVMKKEGIMMALITMVIYLKPMEILLDETLSISESTTKNKARKGPKKF